MAHVASGGDFSRALGDDHRRDDGPDEGLEDVRAHAGHVTHVVAHVVGDDAGVAGVVLRKTSLDLADQVGADVGGLGVDATADTGEEGDAAGTHAETGRVLQRVAGVSSAVVSVAKPEGDDGDAKQAKSAHREPHHGAAVVGHSERSGLTAVLGGHGGASVG